MKNRPVVSAFYFPNWHVDPRNEKLHGKGWTEWRVVQYATPRFPGHHQPHIPLWGYEDEADPVAMRKKIDTAQKYGIDAFTFDYYWFSDGPYRERCLLEGFLPAVQGTDFKFAIMWANHDPIYTHPGSYLKPRESLWSGAIDRKTFTECTDHLIETYFKHPNYLCIEGRPYFSFFNLNYMLQTSGADAVASMIEDLRVRAERAGLKGVWVDGDIGRLHRRDDLPGTTELIRKLNLDSCSLYNYGIPFPQGNPEFPFEKIIGPSIDFTKKISTSIPVPYNPVVPCGWDVSPRSVQSDMYDLSRGYPFTPIAVDDTPEVFEHFLREMRSFLETEESTARILSLACWNEWTEGMFLEPDDQYGYGKLEAVKKVFGTSK